MGGKDKYSDDDKILAMIALVHKHAWNWQHAEGCIPLSDSGCICGLETVKLIILDLEEK